MTSNSRKASTIKSGKILLVTNQIEQAPTGGRELLCKLNHDILKEIYADQCVVVELPKSKVASLRSMFYAFGGHVDGLSAESMGEAIQEILKQNVTKVFVDGSNLGEFVRVVKSEYPHIQVITFFHNVEARFFWGSLKQLKSLRALAVLVVNYLAERKAVKYSDKIICLNERDSHILWRIYGRSATHISAMALQDKLPTKAIFPAVANGEKFALFVGGTFYANQEGISWFVKNVVPRINIKTYIVGRGFEKYKNELEISGKVVVVGGVESLAQWYQAASFVIAPIFDGSGMKTKVAEALMFGKKIIGTPEAFVGYEGVAEQTGRICFSADEFVAAINSEKKVVELSFDTRLRAIYEEQFSYKAAEARLRNIINC